MSAFYGAGLIATIVFRCACSAFGDDHPLVRSELY